MRNTTGIMKVALVVGLIAIALFGLGLPALAIDGPTPPKVSDPAPAGTYPEIQVVHLWNATGGNFTLTLTSGSATAVPPTLVSFGTTGAISYNAAASTVASSLNGLSGVGGVTAVGRDGTPSGLQPFTVTFSGSTNYNVMTVGSSLTYVGLPAGEASVPPEVATVQNGASLLTANVSPHGGYSSQTSYCLQCHQIHYNRGAADAPGEYALMAESSVTATCATCHGFEGDAPTGAENPGLGGQIATASVRAVYTQPEEVHVIGAGFGSVGNTAGWDFYTWAGNGTAGTEGPEGPGITRGVGTASYYNGGLYCGSCHTPHGEFGQLINSQWAITTAGQGPGNPAPVSTPAAVKWAEGKRIWFQDPTPTSGPNGGGVPTGTTGVWKQAYLHNAGTYWQLCGTESGVAGGTVDGAGNCEPALTKDAEGQIVSLYGYKLLTSSPNHQYPFRDNAGNYLVSAGGAPYDPDGAAGPIVAGSVPPAALYSDAPFKGGEVAARTAVPAVAGPNFLTHSSLGTLSAGIASGGAAASLSVNQSNNTDYSTAEPFKIRIDNEILMVTDATAPGASPTFSSTWTVVRAVEPFEPEVACRPWTAGGLTQTGCVASQAVAHTTGASVLVVPTMLVDEEGLQSVLDDSTKSGTARQGGLMPLTSSTSWVRTPFHIQVDSEKMVVLWRTRVGTTGSTYLYTVGRAVDKTAGATHTADTPFNVLVGVTRNSVRSWGVDLQAGDMSSFCGSCHSGEPDVKFGGQFHNHPTGCATCHGNSATSGNDFPHSSDSPFMLQALPDGLCLNCHITMP